MKKKILSVFVAVLAVAMFALPFSLVSAKKETFTLEGTFGAFAYPFWYNEGKPMFPGDPGPFAYAQPAGKSLHLNPAGFDGMPVVWMGDIACGSFDMYDPDGAGGEEPYAVIYEPYDCTYSAHWLMKYYLTFDPSQFDIKITGFFYLKDAEVEGVGVGDLTIKVVGSAPSCKLTIVDGTGELKGLRGKGTYVGNPFMAEWTIEAHINEKLIT